MSGVSGDRRLEMAAPTIGTAREREKEEEEEEEECAQCTEIQGSQMRRRKGIFVDP